MKCFLCGNFKGARIASVELVGISFGIPQNHLVTPAEATLAMKAVAEIPDDSVAKFQAEFFEDRADFEIERHNMSVAHVIADLPANAARSSQPLDARRNDPLLPIQILLENAIVRVSGVRLFKIVGRACEDEVECFSGLFRVSKELFAIAVEDEVLRKRGGQPFAKICVRQKWILERSLPRSQAVQAISQL